MHFLQVRLRLCYSTFEHPNALVARLHSAVGLEHFALHLFDLRLKLLGLLMHFLQVRLRLCYSTFERLVLAYHISELLL